MKKISLFLVCSLLMQSFAFAGPKESLKSVLDEYRYAVTVEWDQKDLSQLDLYKAKLSAELKILVQAEKFSAQDLKSFLLQNSELDQAVIASVSDKNGELNLEKVQSVLETQTDLLYSKGSSWSPNNSLWYGLGILAAFEIVVLIMNTKDDLCPNPANHPNDIPYNCRYEH